MSTTVRYKLDRTYFPKHLYTEKGGTEKIEVPYPQSKWEEVFVDIFEFQPDEDWGKLKLFYSDGTIIEGWTHLMQHGIVMIHNKELLFDGRFNVSS